MYLFALSLLPHRRPNSARMALRQRRGTDSRQLGASKAAYSNSGRSLAKKRGFLAFFGKHFLA
jgi:hypothetical protein